MSYQSKYTGPQIDEAIDEARALIGKSVVVCEKQEPSEGDVLTHLGGKPKWAPPSKPSDEGCVKYTEQTLADDQKAQARDNIGAVSIEDVEELLGIEEEFSTTGEIAQIDLKEDTKVEIISKFHRDSSWSLSNQLALHHVNNSNFANLVDWFDGPQTKEVNGLTITIHEDGILTVAGTSTASTDVLKKTYWSGEHTEKVYPAGMYTIPSGFMMQVRAAKYPSNIAVTGATGNLSGTVTIPESFRIVSLTYIVGANKTVDIRMPLGLFYGGSSPETDYKYTGNLYTVTFDEPIYEGEFNWNTGELKDAAGNIVAYYGAQEIKSFSGANYFWTGFGENTVSNVSNSELGRVGIQLDEAAPAETIASICDFTLTPKTMQAAYGLCSSNFMGVDAPLRGREVPLLTTTGDLVVKDANGTTKYSKRIDNLISYRGISDLLTERGIRKEWSDKFYLNALPANKVYADNYDATRNVTWTWEFTEEDFVNTGIPAKLSDIPMATHCFYNNSDVQTFMNDRVWFSQPYPAKFYYDAESGKYILVAKGTYDSIEYQLTDYSKVYFYYPLETPYDVDEGFAMGISAGDTVSFVEDYSDAQEFIDASVYRTGGSGSAIAEYNLKPALVAVVPRSTTDAFEGMNNAARLLNFSGSTSAGDATVQGYSWIGAGDGTTDYTVKIQSKLDELHSVSNGGTIHLGPGTYPITRSLIVYANTHIIGDGHTVIEQTADNTHAVVWSGSNIRMCDLTIKLSGVCTDLTACIYVNSNNASNNRDDRYPENGYVQYCSTSNIKLVGTYKSSWDGEYEYLSEEALAYRGVGLCGSELYFNFYDCDRLVCSNLYSGVYGGGGSNNYRIYVTHSRFAVHGGGGNNIFDIQGHTYYFEGKDGYIKGTEYIYYGVASDYNHITVGVYDLQYTEGIIYFDGQSIGSHYSLPNLTTPGITTGISTSSNRWYRRVADFGRGNFETTPSKYELVGVGTTSYAISSLPYWNAQFNPSINNALSGAGVWGAITSNKEWISQGMDLSDVCRYPKEYGRCTHGLSSVVCETAPSEESPVEIVIDISNRPIAGYQGFWVQFNHRYVAEDYTVSFDTTNDGEFDFRAIDVVGNTNVISYALNNQAEIRQVYRIKICITKALQIPDFSYQDAAYGKYTVDYNPDGYIGIVNIGMPQNEAYGRAFLGECGGNLYGNVDMHQNTLKNLPDPVDSGDAVSMSYLERRLAALEALINGS